MAAVRTLLVTAGHQPEQPVAVSIGEQPGYFKPSLKVIHRQHPTAFSPFSGMPRRDRCK